MGIALILKSKEPERALQYIIRNTGAKYHTVYGIQCNPESRYRNLAILAGVTCPIRPHQTKSAKSGINAKNAVYGRCTTNLASFRPVTDSGTASNSAGRTQR